MDVPVLAVHQGFTYISSVRTLAGYLVVVFHSISTLVGYFIPNPVSVFIYIYIYIHIVHIYIYIYIYI